MYIFHIKLWTSCLAVVATLSLLVESTKPSLNLQQNSLAIRNRNSQKKITVKLSMVSHRDKIGLKGLLLAAIAANDVASVRWISKVIKARQWKLYAVKCMERFRSKPLCFTDTVSFYIWQQIEVQRMRREILGQNWKFSNLANLREINQFQQEFNLFKK